MFEKFSSDYLINSAFIQPSQTTKALISTDQYKYIAQIYTNKSVTPVIKIPCFNTHAKVEEDASLPKKTIKFPEIEDFFNAKQREYLLATPDSPLHTVFIA